LNEKEKRSILQRQKLPTTFLVIWVVAVILVGGALTSFHQPFQTPAESILALSRAAAPNTWQTVHILSGSCGCSQRVLRHLLDRRPLDGVAEQILLVDGLAGSEQDLPGTAALLEQLQRAGFAVRHLAAKDIPREYGLRGVPLLLVVSPRHHVAYLGGYGSQGDQDLRILTELRSGQEAKVLPVVGCAVGSHLRQQADPFHLKY
jgi:hypothetical protein